jgi:hypothetical protein
MLTFRWSVVMKAGLKTLPADFMAARAETK